MSWHKLGFSSCDLAANCAKFLGFAFLVVIISVSEIVPLDVGVFYGNIIL
jgi:hypothetical protein